MLANVVDIALGFGGEMVTYGNGTPSRRRMRSAGRSSVRPRRCWRGRRRVLTLEA